MGSGLSVAVVVPIYRNTFLLDERISMRHLENYLGDYPIYWVIPADLSVERRKFGIKQFSSEYFESVSTYSKLLLSISFYEAFTDYDFILIYQLDSLVFLDALRDWCDKDYDYIGAPLFNSKTDPASGFSRVGNGGFSLRRVDSFLKVLNSKRYIETPVSYLSQLISTRLPDLDTLSFGSRFLKKLSILRAVRRGVISYLSSYTLNEDLFWSDRARLFDPSFDIPPVDVALDFAFEAYPQYCFEQNRCRLPFGCHAWAKWDREFWFPYLLD